MRNYILYIIIIPCLAFCAISVHAKTDIEVVMNAKLRYDKSMTIGDAFNKFRYFKSKTWKFRQEEDNKKLVIFTGTLDLSDLRRYNNKLGALKAAFIRVIFVLNTDKGKNVGRLNVRYTSEDEWRRLWKQPASSRRMNDAG